MYIKQYYIYEIDISDTIRGDEMPEKTIKAVVISPNEMNDVLKTVLVAPLSSCDNCAETPTTFRISDEFRVRLDQISSSPKKRVGECFGKITSPKIKKIKNTIEEMLVK